MKEENKNEIKKGILTGAGTIAGAVMGVVVEDTIRAADVKVKEIEDGEVANEDLENVDQAPESDQPTTEVESVSSNDKEEAPSPIIYNPERKTTHPNYAGDSIINTDHEEDIVAIVEEETMVEVEAEPEAIVEEESIDDEDIMVVSVSPNESDEVSADVYDAISDGSFENVISEDLSQVPDYADMKDNDLSVGSSMMSTTDMPDYVNDANIDSFTDNV
ncbi:MAG: hypothetical protein K2N35_04200 [Muribaculaceae bacterium]|nr:hypothetical protein [Muribaculaceae bacterium]